MITDTKLTTDVEYAAQLLRGGGLVAFATETVYGLGGNALDPQSVARIFAAKQRPHFDPLIVHLADAGDVEQVVREIPKQAERLMDRFWPGPLTLVLPKQECVPDLVTSGLPSVAVRVPSHPQAREFLRSCRLPVAAPSANPFGRISPTTAAHVLDQLGDEIDCVLDGGPCTIGVESTVLLIREDAPPMLLRAGGVTLEELTETIGEVAFPVLAGEDSDRPQAGPGMLTKHYAPRKPLRIVTDWTDIPTGSRVGLLAFQTVPPGLTFGAIEQLSASGSLTEAAAKFFAALRRLDASPVEEILATPFPTHGLGRALNDRLTRAAASSE